MKLVTAAELCASPDAVAPVSGCRCRSCGHNARSDQPDRKWVVAYGTAYCPNCFDEAEAETGQKVPTNHNNFEEKSC